jgi:hypothetical protein
MLTEGSQVSRLFTPVSSLKPIQVWSSYSVLNVLYSLIQKSKVNEYIVAQRGGRSEEEVAYVKLRFLSRKL